MTTISHTPEQLAIFANLRERQSRHLIINALAGVGKTKTCEDALKLGHIAGTSIYLSFNRSIADEFKQRFAGAPMMIKAQTAISTVHSHGLQAFKKAGRQAQTQGGKLSFLLRDESKSWRPDDPAHRNTRHISKLASMAKNAGFGITSIDPRERFPAINDVEQWEKLVEHFALDLELEGGYAVKDLICEAMALLMQSNRKLSMIDFDDMVYLPLLLNLPITQYDNVLIDEAQDINATRRELAFRSLKPNGRIIAVGDPNQAIYGFTGASTQSLDDIRNRADDCTTLPLSTCWRCSDAVLDKARLIVPGIKTAPAKLNTGIVRSVDFRSDTADFLAEPQPGDAILCRLNKPNVAVALGLLRRGTPAKIEGRDLGRKLLDHVKKAEDAYSFQPLADQLAGLENYKVLEQQKLLSKEREAAAELLADEVDAAILLCERAIEVKLKASFTDLEALVESLFGDEVKSSAVVTLSSIHKAKGREWHRVFILGRFEYMPFWKAEAGWQLVQEYNLIYVAETRAEFELVYVSGVQSALDKGLHRLPAVKGVLPSPDTSTHETLQELDCINIEVNGTLDSYFRERGI